jgi:hypothetical protein
MLNSFLKVRCSSFRTGTTSLLNISTPCSTTTVGSARSPDTDEIRLAIPSTMSRHGADNTATVHLIKSDAPLRRPFAFYYAGHRRPTSALATSVANADFSKVGTALEASHRGLAFLESKKTIDQRLQPLLVRALWRVQAWRRSTRSPSPAHPAADRGGWPSASAACMPQPSWR